MNTRMADTGKWHRRKLACLWLGERLCQPSGTGDSPHGMKNHQGTLRLPHILSKPVLTKGLNYLKKGNVQYSSNHNVPIFEMYQGNSQENRCKIEKWEGEGEAYVFDM